jgi:glycosyltransferase involved in cell wall biosynthesis
VLVLGWQTYGHLQAMRAARAAGIPLLVRGESHLRVRPVSRARAIARALLWLPARELVYRTIFAAVDGFLPIGTWNREFYRHFGVPERKFFWAPYCVDNRQFALPRGSAATVRRRMRDGIGVGPDTVVFTSAGKLIARKSPLDILEAFSTLIRAGLDVHLLYLGDGPERAPVEARIDALGLTGRVSISGFVNQSALAEWYVASDCLVLASLAETWGLVVNEAMAAGLPVLVSDVAGCAPDLVRDGVNGFTFPAGDSAALADRMRAIAVRTPEERAGMGTQSAEIVADYTVERAAQGVVDAALEVVHR